MPWKACLLVVPRRFWRVLAWFRRNEVGDEGQDATKTAAARAGTVGGRTSEVLRRPSVAVLAAVLVVVGV